jgi:hypothetical protein
MQANHGLRRLLFVKTHPAVNARSVTARARLPHCASTVPALPGKARRPPPAGTFATANRRPAQPAEAGGLCLATASGRSAHRVSTARDGTASAAEIAHILPMVLGVILTRLCAGQTRVCGADLSPATYAAFVATSCLRIRHGPTWLLLWDHPNVTAADLAPYIAGLLGGDGAWLCIRVWVQEREKTKRARMQYDAEITKLAIERTFPVPEQLNRPTTRRTKTTP